MPLYEVNTVTVLTQAQKQGLAEAITRIHTHYFTTPSVFVNVRFNLKELADEKLNYFVAGKPHASNSIFATVRTGGGRTADKFETAAKEIAQAWDQVVNDGQKDGLPLEKQLRAVFLIGDVLVALEAGFVVPKAGEDVKWMRENIKEFQKRATAGDSEFADLLEEIRTREDLKDLF